MQHYSSLCDAFWADAMTEKTHWWGHAYYLCLLMVMKASGSKSETSGPDVLQLPPCSEPTPSHMNLQVSTLTANASMSALPSMTQTRSLKHAFAMQTKVFGKVQDSPKLLDGLHIFALLVNDKQAVIGRSTHKHSRQQGLAPAVITCYCVH